MVAPLGSGSALVQIFPNFLRYCAEDNAVLLQNLKAEERRYAKRFTSCPVIRFAEAGYVGYIKNRLADQEVGASLDFAVSQPGLCIQPPAQIQSGADTKIRGRPEL